MKLKEWQEKHKKMREMSERIISMRRDRYLKVVKQSGLDSTIAGIHVHNALAGLHYGHPWKGINYSLVRLAKRLDSKMYESSRIIELWDKRVRGY